MDASAESFDRLGPREPLSPVVISVPHAGRDYPAAMRAALRAPVNALLPLEDRYVDALARAARGEETMAIQRMPRAWIDLNRSELERDPLLDDGANPTRQPAPSLKLRSGLGLVPRRVGSVNEIWRGRLRAGDVAARIERDHRPYHAAIADALRAARARFGTAVLVDLHSMPPLGPVGEAAQIVFGDRFGRSAAARFVARIEAVADAHGVAHALNTPYAGGHILDLHGDPVRGIHAVQIEFDRRLYLDAMLDQPGPGLPAAADLLREMLAALADEALGTRDAIAAE